LEDRNPAWACVAFPSGEFVVQVQAPNVEEAIVLAFEKYREKHKNLEYVLDFHVDAKNLTIEKLTRSGA
jgi:hypothetical protein